MATAVGSTSYPATSPGPLEVLLAEVCEALQLSPTQYQTAVEHYEAVGRWLAADDSPVARYSPRIYAQGSVALGTSTRPATDADEYDVDAVLEVLWPGDPMALYRLVDQRLSHHGTYSKLLERKPRCLCLNFREDDGVFHLDVLPARRDFLRGGSCIEVPDRRKPEIWQPSNPLGYIAWFDESAEAGLNLARREQQPLPPNLPAHAKSVLKQVIQLMKRRRDLMLLNDREDAPRSIVLTTLAATHYRGELSVLDALAGILTRICAEAMALLPSRVVVVNPTNPAERFCESFTTERRYQLFIQYLTQFRAEVELLTKTTGLARIDVLLSDMFGGAITKRALKQYANRLSAARETEAIRVQDRSGVGGISAVADVASARGIVVPKNVFFGG